MSLEQKSYYARIAAIGYRVLYVVQVEYVLYGLPTAQRRRQYGLRYSVVSVRRATPRPYRSAIACVSESVCDWYAMRCALVLQPWP
jgi:hypothetical protein